MIIIEQDQESGLDHLKNLMIIHSGFSGTKRDEEAPKASVVSILDVVDLQDRFFDRCT
jgi:hypothetical protein